MGGIDGRRILSTLARSALAAIPASAVGWLIAEAFLPLPRGGGVTDVFAAVGVCVAVAVPMLLIYGTALRLLRVDELSEVLDPLLRRLRGRVR
jgi:putative peptidoglycan lipid II flippase